MPPSHEHPAPQAQRPGLSAQQRRILPVLLIPAFVSLLAVSSVNIILPVVAGSLGAGSGGLQLVISGYALVFGVLLVPAGRAGDVLGRGRLFIIGLLVFGLGSLASGLAGDIIVLNLARIVMGVGAGLFNPQVTGMIQQYYAGELRGRAFGVLGAVIGVSVAVGPVLAGSLIAVLGPGPGWRASFLLNVPFTLVGIWAARRALPASAWSRMERPAPAGPGRSTDDGAERRGGPGTPRGGSAPGAVPGSGSRSGSRPAGPARPDLDPVGMALLTAGTVLIMIPLSLPGAGPWAWSLAGAGLAVVGTWAAWERGYARRGRAPMVDLDLFRIPSFAYGSLAISIHFLGYTAVWVIVVQYVQSGLGHSALASGLIGLPAALCSAVSSAAAGRRVMRVGRAMVLWGMLLCMAGMAGSIAVVHLHAAAGSSPWWMALTLAVVGVGQGMVVSPNQALSLADVPVEHAGTAGGVMQTGERIGTAIGIAAITGVVFEAAAGPGWPTATQVGLAIEIVVIALAASVAAADLRAARRRRAAG